MEEVKLFSSRCGWSPQPSPALYPQIIRHLHSYPADTHRTGFEGWHTLSTLSDAPAVDRSCVPGAHQERLQVVRHFPVAWVGQCFFYCMGAQYRYLDI